MRLLRLSLCFAVAAVGLCSLAETALAQSLVTAPALPPGRMLSRYGLEQEWWSQAVLNPGRDKILHLTADEDNCYVQSTSNILTCFNADTGEKLYSTQLGRQNTPAYPAVSNQKVVLVADSYHLYCLDKFNGKLRWQIKLPGVASTSPEIDEEHVYVGTQDGNVFAFSLEKIQETYNEGLLPDWSYQTQVWKYSASSEITTKPISTGIGLLFASNNGKLHAVTTARRETIFQVRLKAPISAPLARQNNFVYLAAEDFNFYCLNMFNGSMRWDFVTSLPIRKAPVVIEGDVYLTPEGGGMFSISTRSGERQWWRPAITQFVAATPKFVYATNTTGDLVLLNRQSGGLVGSMPLRGFPIRISNARTDRIFLATESGRVVCLAQTDLPFAKYYLYPDRRPILPEVPLEKPDPNATAPAPADDDGL